MPSSAEWERREHRIRELRKTETLEGLMAKLKKDGFDATKAQYEHYIRKWDARRYLSASEWPNAIAAYDSAVNRYGEDNVQLLIAGKPVERRNITRYRRRYCRQTDTRTSNDGLELPRGVVLEVRIGDSCWVQPDAAALPVGDTTEATSNEMSWEQPSATGGFPAPSEVQELPFADFTLGHPVTDANAVERPHPLCDSPTFEAIQATLSALAAYRPCELETLALAGTENDDSWHGAPWQLNTQSPGFPFLFNGSSIDEPLSNQLCRSSSRGGTPLAIFLDSEVSPIHNVPFIQLEKALQRMGIDIGSIKIHQPKSQPLFALYEQQHFLRLFMSDLRLGSSCLANLSLANAYVRTAFVDSLLTLLPGEPINASNVGDADNKLLRILLFLFANNFPGCQDLNISSLLSFLGRFVDLNRLLSRLTSIPGANSYRKSVAAGLFRASIEAQEIPLVQKLVRLGLFGVDDIKFHVFARTKTYHATALGKAVSLGHLDLVRSLLDTRANPNAAFENRRGPIAFILIAHRRRQTWFSDAQSLFCIDYPRARDLIHCLIERGAIVRPRDAYWGLMGEFPEMAYEVILRCVQDDHVAYELEIEWLLKEVARPTSRTTMATDDCGKMIHTIIREIYRVCRNVHDGQCLNRGTGGWPAAIGDDDVQQVQAPRADLVQDERQTQLDQVRAAAELGKYQTACNILLGPPFSCGEAGDEHGEIWDSRELHDIASLLLRCLARETHCISGDDLLVRMALRTHDASLMNTIMDRATLDTRSSWLRLLVRLGEYDCIRKAYEIFPITLGSGRIGVGLGSSTKKMRQFLIDEKIVGQGVLNTWLSAAIWSNNAILVEEMIHLGADAGDMDVLQMAAKATPEILARLLRVPKATTPFPSPDKQLQLISIAIESREPREMLKMLQDSDKIDIPKIWPPGPVYVGCTMLPLGMAIQRWEGDPRRGFVAMQFLLESGSNPNQVVSERDYGAETPLLMAIRVGSLPLVELLLEHGANAKRKTDHGVLRTPLQKAAEVGRLDILQLLLKHGVEVNAEPAIRNGGTALQFAAISGNCNVANTLLEQGADLYQEPSLYHGRWPLKGAAECGRMDMIALLWRWAAVNKRSFSDEMCQRAMELAVKEGHDVCKELIEELGGPKFVPIEHSMYF